MMNKLTIEEIKRCSFEVLCQIRDICEENGLTYSLSGGTLIGAVRHQGFIPWDDDIDIMMPRPDYDRFLEIVRRDGAGFDLHCELDGEDYAYPFAKACHKKTEILENGTLQTDSRLGVYVDIFPVDGAGNRFWTAKLRTMVFVAIHGLKVTSNWTRFHGSKLRKWYYEPLRYGCYLLSKLLGRQRIDKLLQAFLHSRPFEDCAYAGRLVGDYGSKEIMPQKLFLDTVQVTFEGESFAAVRDYDTFLTRLYGNYMQLPPEEKQVSHHDFEAYWVE